MRRVAAISAARLVLGCLAIVLAGKCVAADGSRLQAVIDSAHDRFHGVEDGKLAGYIPALAAADPDAFGIVAVTVGGEVHSRGDVDRPFAIMSSAKPFTLALLLERQGLSLVTSRIGVEPTGLPFNSLLGIDPGDHRALNPMVNAGAIMAVSLLDAASAGERWKLIRDFYSQLAGERVDVLHDVYTSVAASNYRNRALANLLAASGRLGADPDGTLGVYNLQSSVAVSATRLAVMGATLANAGINPMTGEQVMSADNVAAVLAVMMLDGMYDESGSWAVRAGLPAKSGVGGGIVAIVPGVMSIAAFSPRLSDAGNSVRAMLAIEYVSRELSLSLFEP